MARPRPGPYLAEELLVDGRGRPPRDPGEHHCGGDPYEEQQQDAEAEDHFIEDQPRVVQYATGVCGRTVVLLASIGL